MALTRDNLFWDAFANHAERSVRAAELLEKMLGAPLEAETIARQITVLENEGDKITHECISALHQTWITPLDREEIHTLMTSLDDMLDYIEAASERFALFDITETRPESLDLARVLRLAAEDTLKAVQGLKSMKDAKELLAACVSINRREEEADGILRRGLARLFREEKDALTVIKWRDIFEALESATDRAEDVANVIEGIALEHG